MHVAIIIDDGCGLTAAEVMLAAVRLVAYLARTVSVSFCINKKVVVLVVDINLTVVLTP